MNVRGLILALLVAWILGAVFLPLGGMIHFLLIVVIIVGIVDRVGRQP